MYFRNTKNKETEEYRKRSRGLSFLGDQRAAVSIRNDLILLIYYQNLPASATKEEHDGHVRTVHGERKMAKRVLSKFSLTIDQFYMFQLQYILVVPAARRSSGKKVCCATSGKNAERNHTVALAVPAR